MATSPGGTVITFGCAATDMYHGWWLGEAAALPIVASAPLSETTTEPAAGGIARGDDGKACTPTAPASFDGRLAAGPLALLRASASMIASGDFQPALGLCGSEEEELLLLLQELAGRRIPGGLVGTVIRAKEPSLFGATLAGMATGATGARKDRVSPSLVT